MEDIFTADNDATSLTFEEKEDLIPSYITTKGELNEAEQFSILNTRLWALKGKKDILDEATLKKLHKKMFDDVWKWAGKYRTTQKNIGIEPYRISMELNQLISDVKFWVENNSFSIEEIAARLHHKLVWIHPFPNGNGRFSRLATDIFLKFHNHPFFEWGENLESINERRRKYIEALRAADQHDIGPLMRLLKKE